MYHIRNLLFMLLMSLYVYPGYSLQPKMTLKELKKQINQQFERVPGIFALAFKNLDKPDEIILINEKENFHAASTMKTPVMIELFKQAAAGKFSLADSIVVKNEFKSIVDGSAYSMDISEDSGEGLYKMIGKPMTIEALIYDMITYSSNLATNILIEMADATKVTQTMRSLGARDIQVLRGVEDGKAYQQGLNNTTNAYDLMIIFEKLALGQIVNQKASDEMIRVLESQHFNEIIPARLPKEVKVAHKTGSITGVQHDSGIVYLPDGRKYVLVILSKGLPDTAQAVNMMSEVSAILYRYVQQMK